MLVPRRQGYIALDFTLLDSGLLTVIPAPLIHLYWQLRCYVWRSATKGCKISRDAWEKGYLATVVSQNELADMLGTTRPRINQRVAQLRALGWIKTIQHEDQPLLYVLGAVIPNENGHNVESFFADAHLAHLWEGLHTYALNRGHETAMDLPYADRRNWMRDALGLGEGVSERDTGGVSERDTGGVSERDTGGVSERVTGGVSERVTLLNREEESTEEESTEEQIPPNFPSEVPALRTGTPPEKFAAGVFGPQPTLGVGKQETTGNKKGGKSRKEKSEQDPRNSAAGTLRKSPVAGSGSGYKKLPDVDPEYIELLRRKNVREIADMEEDKRKARRSSTARENLKGASLHPRHADALRVLESEWKAEMREVMPDAKLGDWNVKLRKKMADTAEQYGVDALKLAIQYAVRNWEGIKGNFKATSSIPSLHLVCGIADQFINDAAEWRSIQGAVDALHDWRAKNPGRRAPAEVQTAFDKVYPKAKQLGMVR